MATIVTIKCDGCGYKPPSEWVNVGNGVWAIRLGLNQKGWQTNHNTRRDFCPTCVARKLAPKKRPKVKK